MRRLVCLLIVATAACSSEMDRPRMSGPSEGDAARSPARSGTDAALQPRNATRPDTVRIEGEIQRVTTRLVETAEDFVLPFSTYVPERMELSPGPGAEMVRLVWPFGESRVPGITLRVYPQGVSVADAVASTRTSMNETYDVEDRELPGSWSHTGFGFRARAADPPSAQAGWVGFAARRGRTYSIEVRYFAEMADGLGPWSELVLRRWRWEDTGEMLHP